jgi:hypothetical protein
MTADATAAAHGTSNMGGFRDMAKSAAVLTQNPAGNLPAEGRSG